MLRRRTAGRAPSSRPNWRLTSAWYHPASSSTSVRPEGATKLFRLGFHGIVSHALTWRHTAHR